MTTSPLFPTAERPSTHPAVGEGSVPSRVSTSNPSDSAYIDAGARFVAPIGIHA